LTTHDASTLSRLRDVALSALRRVGFAFCLIVGGRAALLEAARKPRIHSTWTTAMKLIPLLLLVVCAAAANLATAATRDEQSKACKHDAIKFCAIHIPNKEKIEACMKEHYDKLSPKCQAMFDPPDASSDSPSSS
jgi:hypothetical protein